MEEANRAKIGIDVSSERAERRHRSGDPRVHEFAIEVARLCHDRHCENVLIFDARGLSDVTDYILITSGTSDRQIKAVGDEISDLGEQRQVERFGSDRDDAVTWFVLDFVDLVVHLFEPTARAHYDLEMLWNDAPKIEWRR